MWKGFICICLFLLAGPGLLWGQQPSALAGTWVGHVQGYGVEMKMVLNADGTADYEGEMGKWRTQGNKLLLSQEGETIAYDFRLTGSELVLSGGDLMAPLKLTRAGGSPATPQAFPQRPPEEETRNPAPPSEQPTSPSPEKTAQPTRAKSAGSPPRPADAKARPLTESDITQLLEGSVSSKRIRDLVEGRGVSFSVTPTLASRLKAKGATEELIAALREAAPAAQAAAKPVSQAAGGARGPRYAHDRWGLSFAVPPNWKVGERRQALLLGSDTEPGLIVIRFVRKTTVQALAADYNEGLTEEGLQLMPSSPVEEFAAGGARGLAGEMGGVSADGYRLRARIIGVSSPYGDAAVVLGLTTEEKYPQLRPRVEAMAASMTFVPPKAAPVNEAVAGQYAFFYSSSVGGSYSRQDLLNLCSDGTFRRGGEIYSSGGAGMAAGQSGNAGEWSAEGDEVQGVITLQYRGGRSEQVEYRRSGPDIILGERKYTRYGDGTCSQPSPF